MLRFFCLLIFVAFLNMPAYALSGAANASAALAQPLADIEERWVDIRYDMRDYRARFEAALELKQKSLALMQANPDATEAKVWYAKVLLLEPELRRELSTLALVREAKRLLEEAEAQNPTAMGGQIYTALGMLYAEVPGWPIGFGDDKQAHAYFRKALAIDGGSMETNYLYGDFLTDRGRLRDALICFERAAEAPIRPDHVRADTYRHEEIEKDLAALRRRLKS